MADPIVSVKIRVHWAAGPVLAGTADAAMRGLTKWGNLVLAMSNARVPHDSGDLERSGAVTPDPGSVSVRVSYDTPYARRQHEELDWQHEGDRSAKYLESAVHDSMERGLALVAEDLAGVLR